MQKEQVIQEALRGSRKMKITFKRTSAATRDIKWLLRMHICDTLSLVYSQMKLLIAAANSGKWDRDYDRTVIVTLTSKFDKEWFIERLYRSIEKIEVINTK